MVDETDTAAEVVRAEVATLAADSRMIGQKNRRISPHEISEQQYSLGVIANLQPINVRPS